jgi:drug/metabolite transporter (DMT)-like permease
MLNIPYLGETMALAAAAAWAFAVILFKKSGETVHPIALNLFKNILAFILFLITMYVMGQSLNYPATTGEYLLLIASGILGIGISDTLFFQCLNRLGAGLTAIVDCLYSPFIIGLSLIWLGDSLSVWQIVGVVMIISAVLTVAGKKGGTQVSRRDAVLGFIYGALAMATMAVGIVMIKPLLNRSPLLWVTEVRLAAGIAVLLIYLLLHPSRRRIVASVGSVRQWGYTFSGSFIGAYLAMLFWIAGMKFTQTSIAAALNQSNNIFIFILAAWFLKEPINRQRVIGIILAVAGSLLVTFA